MASPTVSGERTPTRVGAVFDDGVAAREGARRLTQRTGVPGERVAVLGPDDRDVDRVLEPEIRGIRTTFLRTHLAFGLGGLLAGTLLALLLAVAGGPVFASQPVYSVLAGAFLGAVAGLLAGGAIALRPDHDQFIHWARKALGERRWVLVVYVFDSAERRKVMDALREISGRTAATI